MESMEAAPNTFGLPKAFGLQVPEPNAFSRGNSELSCHRERGHLSKCIWKAWSQIRLVCQMRLACKYLNQTHFLVEIVNSRDNETRNTYLNPLGKHEGFAKHVWFAKCVWFAK